MPRIRIEVCTDSVDSAKAAEAGGADRIELCQNLFEGGTTPSEGIIRKARQVVGIPLFVIIRPRGGDFLHNQNEFDVMKHDIAAVKNLGTDGVVLGLLRSNGDVDKRRTAQLIKLARPLHVTFHRAFDMTRDPGKALEDIIDLGCERLLTSGQEISVLEGADLIRHLLRQAGRRLIIMPGGGLTESNFVRVRKQTGAKEFHVTGNRTIKSPMVHRNQDCFMGKELRPPEYQWTATDAGRISAYRQMADE